MRFLLALTLPLTISFLHGQSLQQKIAEIAASAKGKVYVSCSLPETHLPCDKSPRAHPPMQSVFKWPLIMTALHRIELGDFRLDQPVRFLASDRILPKTFSPLQDRYPAGDVDVPLRKLMQAAVGESDNTAADIVLRIVGGPAAVSAYIESLGVSGFHLQDGEAALHKDDALQYRNWFEPAAAVQLLRLLDEHSPLTAEHTRLLRGWMTDSSTGLHRIKGKLPKGTVVMHKTGTSGTHEGFTPATNDVGLIVLPDGRHLTIAVFVTDSRADEATREGAIAGIARAVYDEANSTQAASKKL